MSRLLFIITLFTIYYLSWRIQSSLFLSWDINYMLHATSRMLDGGTYTYDFFNPNPPIIFYLYTPVILAHSLIPSITITVLFRCYIFLLLTLILSLSYALAKKILGPRTKGFILLTAITLFIFPLYETGQREHLIAAFLLPYILLLANRVEKHKLNPALIFPSAILAGIAFAIKPHYLLILLFIEIYYGIKTKRWLAFIRPETAIIVFIVLTHYAFIYYLYPDYFTILTPYLLRLYYPAVSDSLFNLVSNAFMISILLAAILYYVLSNIRSYSSIYSFLFILTLGFFIAYILQQTTFYYHLLPCIITSTLLVYLICIDHLKRDPVLKHNYFFLGIIFIFFFNTSYNIYTMYNQKSFIKKTIQPIVSFLKSHNTSDPIMFFNTEVSLPLLTIEQTQNPLGQRYDCLWTFAGLANTPITPQWKQDQHFFITMIKEDLIHYKPRFVFIDIKEPKAYIQPSHFNYLTWLQSDAGFNKEWKLYHHFATIKELPYYELDIYQRTDDA